MLLRADHGAGGILFDLWLILLSVIYLDTPLKLISAVRRNTVNSTIVPDKQLQECCKGEVNVYTWHSFGGR